MRHLALVAAVVAATGALTLGASAVLFAPPAQGG